LVGETGQELIDLLLDFRYDFRMTGSDIVTFLRIGGEVVEFWIGEDKVAATTGGCGAIGAGIVACDVEFPIVPAGALQVPIVEIEKQIAIDRLLLA